MKETLLQYCLRNGQEALLDEWCGERNGEWTPGTITSSSGKKAWWRCDHGHIWRAAVYSRVKQGSGCPYCANRLVWADCNDLASQAPELARQWYQPLNGDITPQTVLARSHYKAWWICPLGHVWRTQVQVRAVKGHGCPGCAGQGKRVVFSITPAEQDPA